MNSRDDEEAEQNVGEPIEANGAGITEAETAEEVASPDPRFVRVVLELLDPIGLHMFDVSDQFLDILGKTFLMDRSGRQASEALSPSQLPHVPRSPGLWHHQLFAHIDGKDGPADVLAKSRSSKEWFALLKPLIFWRSDSKNDADGAHDGSHIVEGSDIRSPLLWPHHPRVLGTSVCASTRCFLAGLSSGSPCIATVATPSLFENNCSSCLSFFLL